MELTLNAGEKLKNYDYQVSVPAQCIDEKTAQSYFSRAEKEIDETFFPRGRRGCTCNRAGAYEAKLCERIGKSRLDIGSIQCSGRGWNDPGGSIKIPRENLYRRVWRLPVKSTGRNIRFLFKYTRK